MAATIKGIVFHDQNHLGVYSPNDSGLANIFIALESPDHQFSFTSTDSLGYYTFSDIDTPGEYILYEVIDKPTSTEVLPTTLIQPFGYNGSTTPRKYHVSISNQQITEDTLLDMFNFGHDFSQDFETTHLAYQIDSDKSFLSTLNLVTGTRHLITSLSQSGDYTCISYNCLDQYIYGYDQTSHCIFRLSSSGIIILYDVPNLPPKQFSAGAIDAKGHLYLYEPLDIDYYIVDVNASSPTYMYLISPVSQVSTQPALPIAPLSLASWSFNPTNDYLYAINSEGCVLQINNLDGTYQSFVTTGTPLTTCLTTLFDYSGHIYCIFDKTPCIYKITLDSIATTATAEVFAYLNDPPLPGAAKCSYSPLYINLGSAPDTCCGNSNNNYSTSLANDGPRHAITNILCFGEATTAPLSCKLPELLLTDSTYTFTISLLNHTQQDAYLYAWLDLNGNGIFEGIEGLPPLTIPSILDETQEVSLTFNLPADYPFFVGTTYCRLRLTTDGLINKNLDPLLADTRSLGPASDGQVVDLAFNITGLPPTGPDALYEICTKNKGVSQTLSVTDPCHGQITHSVTRPPLHGTVLLDYLSGEWSYTPEKDYVGEDFFIIRCLSSISSLHCDIQVVVHTQLVELDVHLEADCVECTPEDTLTYTAYLTNRGTIVLSNLLLGASLPSCIHFIPNSIFINGLHTPDMDLDKGIALDLLAVEEFCKITFQCSIDSEATSIESYCTCDYQYIPKLDDPPCESSQLSHTIITTVKYPELAALLTSSVSDTLSQTTALYELLLTNTGNLPLYKIKPKLDLEAPLSLVNTLSVNDIIISNTSLNGYIIDELSPQQSVSLKFTLEVGTFEETTTVDCQAELDFEYLLDHTVHYRSTSSTNYSLLVHVPNLQLTKTADKTNIALGENFHYTFTATNESELPVHNVTIQDTLPHSFELLSVKGEKDYLPTELSSGITLGTLAPHSSKSIIATVKPITRLAPTLRTSTEPQGIFEVLLPGYSETLPIHLNAHTMTSVAITDAELKLSTTLSTFDATTNEKITYTLYLANTGTVTLDEVVIQDLLNADLKFVPHSVTFDDAPLEDASIISGITLTNLAVNTSHKITFEVMVISKVSKTLSCGVSAHYTYKQGDSNTLKFGIQKSNICELNLHYVCIGITGEVDHSLAFLNDEINYTISVKNLGDSPALNIILRNTFSSYELVDSSFKIDGLTIHSVNLTKGINIGSLVPNGSLAITYTIKISENYYPLDTLTSSLSATFAYITGENNIKYSSSNQLDLAVPLALSTFRQIDLESYFEIADPKPDLETINFINGEITLLNHYIIPTPKGISIEGQKLSGHKLIIHGLLELTIEYVSHETTHSIYSSYHTLPFSTYIVLPSDFPIHSRVRISPTLQNVAFKLVNTRSFFTSASILAVAYIK